MAHLRITGRDELERDVTLEWTDGTLTGDEILRTMIRSDVYVGRTVRYGQREAPASIDAGAPLELVAATLVSHLRPYAIDGLELPELDAGAIQ